MKRFYITTPIYYVNARPHIGSAYTTVACDVLSRWHRMNGEDVFFLTGTDEHGEKVFKTAQQAGISPIEICNQNSARFEKSWDTLKISYNNFIRTTDIKHKQAVEAILNKLKAKDLIYLGEYKGLYCVPCERYYSVKELKKGKCPFHNKKPIALSENCYFLKISSFQDKLIKLIKKKDFLIEPIERRNEVLGFLTSNKLEDLAISREKVEWGIKIPWDNSHVVYVWIDALINYLSGIGWSGNFKKWPKYWPANIQLIGKDILRFHAVIWPAILLAINAPFPKKLYAHGFFTVNGQKMSKSLGNVIDPEKLATIFDTDALRWLLLGVFPFGQDGDISMSGFYDKYNNDLCNGIGNLLRRVTTLATKNNKKFIHPARVNSLFKQKINKTWKEYEENMNKLKFERVIKNTNDFVGFLDKYIDKQKPWQVSIENKEYTKIIYNLLEGIRHLSWMICPFMPDKSNDIFESLGLLKEKGKTIKQGQTLFKNDFKKINKGKILFPKL